MGEGVDLGVRDEEEGKRVCRKRVKISRRVGGDCQYAWSWSGSWSWEGVGVGSAASSSSMPQRAAWARSWSWALVGGVWRWRVGVKAKEGVVGVGEGRAVAECFVVVVGGVVRCVRGGRRVRGW